MAAGWTLPSLGSLPGPRGSAPQALDMPPPPDDQEPLASTLLTTETPGHAPPPPPTTTPAPLACRESVRQNPLARTPPHPHNHPTCLQPHLPAEKRCIKTSGTHPHQKPISPPCLQRSGAPRPACRPSSLAHVGRVRQWPAEGGHGLSQTLGHQARATRGSMGSLKRQARAPRESMGSPRRQARAMCRLHASRALCAPSTSINALQGDDRCVASITAAPYHTNYTSAPGTRSHAG